tara:strand:+ start:3798 stop:5015 length:1218 start_codon:yes stop_codon:yes gene_type:complete
MPNYALEVQFFNTFILRPEASNRVYIEESRIKGGYNEDFVSIGPKAHLVDENYSETRRDNALIYSGIYNSRTDVNKTNVFNAAENITRAVDPANGSIQRLHAEDTNLNILQEDKVSYALIDKDALFTAEGGQLTASGAKVIGQIVPYLGKYGCQNPESFAVKGMRKYFADKSRGAIIRLSRDGITEISSAGMRDYFKDNLKLADKVVGGYDDSSDEYIVSLQGTNISGTYDTLTYDESVKGWVSFYNYKPDFIFSLNKEFYSLYHNNVWEHYVNNNYNTFYGETVNARVTFVANANPSDVKNFSAINYEGSPGWEMTGSNTDYGAYATKVLPSTDNTTGDIVSKFVDKEGKYYSQLMNTNAGVLGQISGVRVSGVKGTTANVTMKHTSTNEVELFSVSHNVTISS